MITPVAITAISGNFGAAFEMGVDDSGGPLPTVLIPTITSINGIAPEPAGGGNAHILVTQLGSLWPTGGLETDIYITGTNLDLVTGIQLDYADYYTYWGGGDYQKLDPSSNTASGSGQLIVPCNVTEGPFVSLAYTIISPTRIRITQSAIQNMEAANNGVGGGWFFPCLKGGIQFPVRAENWLAARNANVFDTRNTFATDIWWVFRLWYNSGTVRQYTVGQDISGGEVTSSFVNWRGPDGLRLLPLGDTPLSIGDTLQYTPELFFMDASTLDVTGDPAVFYSIDNPAVATIDENSGLVTAVGAGTANVFADYNGAIYPPSDNSVTVSGIPGDFITVFSISANPNYEDDVSATTYLEAYPMWKGTNSVYMTASTATPDPPKTGHAAVEYDSSTGVVNVSSSASSGADLWNGTYNPTVPSGSPWQDAITGMYDYGTKYLTKGYAGSTWTGQGSNDGTDWILVNSTGTGGSRFRCTVDTGLPALTASIEYYAQYVIVDGYSGYQLDMGGSPCGRVVHIVAYSTDAGAFADVTSVNLRNEFGDPFQVSSVSLTFKKLSNSELLCYLPTVSEDNTRWPSTTGNNRTMHFVFTRSDTSTFETYGGFRAFTGV